MTTAQQVNDNFRLFLTGADVNRYRLDHALYIDTTCEDSNYEAPSFFEPPKLLVRKTGVGIYAAIDYEQSLTKQVVYIFRKKEEPREDLSEVSIEYGAGLLSSRAMLAC